MTAERSTITRRRALSGAATAGIGLPLLAACGDDGGGSTASDPTSSATPRSSDPAPTSAAPEGSASSASGGAGIPTADVPVGGGLIQDDVVITQPQDGDFRAFTAVCTHQQCLVTSVSDGTINCPCHGSKFSIEDGSVTAGPAGAPLEAVDVSVEGDRVVLG